MSEPHAESELEPRTTATEIARDAIADRVLNRLGPDDRDFVLAALKTLMEDPAKEQLQAELLEIKLMLTRWCTANAAPFLQREIALVEAKNALLEVRSVLLRKAFGELAAQASNTEGTETELLDALRRAAFAALAEGRATELRLAEASEKFSQTEEPDVRAVLNPLIELIRSWRIAMD